MDIRVKKIFAEFYTGKWGLKILFKICVQFVDIRVNKIFAEQLQKILDYLQISRLLPNFATDEKSET